VVQLSTLDVMKIDPIVISLIALAVSILSLIISSYRAAVDRRLQWEHLRGSVRTQLASRGVELLTLIEELRRFPGDESITLIGKLIQIAEGIIDIRRKLKEMEAPPLFFTSALVTRFAPIKSDLDDAEPIFDKLRSDIMESNFSEANKVADGLLVRIYGAGGKTPNKSPEPTGSDASV
jgi:hypothetical protein